MAAPQKPTQKPPPKVVRHRFLPRDPAPLASPSVELPFPDADTAREKMGLHLPGDEKPKTPGWDATRVRGKPVTPKLWFAGTEEDRLATQPIRDKAVADALAAWNADFKNKAKQAAWSAAVEDQSGHTVHSNDPNARVYEQIRPSTAPVPTPNARAVERANPNARFKRPASPSGRRRRVKK